MQRLHGGDRRHAVLLAPGEELGDGAGVGPPRVRVADGGRKEFQEADAGVLAGGGDERGNEMGRGARERDRALDHDHILFASKSRPAALSSFTSFIFQASLGSRSV